MVIFYVIVIGFVVGVFVFCILLIGFYFFMVFVFVYIVCGNMIVVVLGMLIGNLIIFFFIWVFMFKIG